MENVKLSKRFCAYLLDIILVFFFTMLVTSIRFINPTYDEYYESYEKYSEVLESYYDGDINEVEMLKQNNTNFYNLNKYSLSYNIAIVIILVGYFVFFQKFNKGQTLGKQVMKIKVVGIDEKDSILKFLVRSIFTYYIYIGSILPLIINMFLLLIGSKYYMITSVIINYIFLIFTVINIIVMFIRKDKRCLHDLISKTKVINA